jgi:hypothetical protein
MRSLFHEWRTELVTFIVSPIIFYIIYKTGRTLKKIVKFAFDWLLWAFAKRTMKVLAARLSMRHYCKSQLNSDANKFLAVPGHRNVPLSVDEMFVPLTIEYGDRKQTQYASLELLEKGNRIIVVGDPGSGKSSLAKYLLREGCRTAQKAPTRSKLPIRLELKKLKIPSIEPTEEEGAEYILAELRRRVGSVEGYDMRQLFDSCVSSSGLLLLLDGLDEVSGDDYPATALALRGLSRILAAKSDQNVIVITMRIQYYQQVGDQLIDDYPQVAYLRSFNPNEIYTFLTKWPFSDSSREKDVARIYADLTDRPTLREMCSNPLVLAMYVARDQTMARGEIPETRTEFYTSVADELLVMRRRRQDIVRGPSRALRELREEILGELAYYNLIDAAQPANSLKWSEALQVTAKTLGVDEPEAERRFQVLETETGIVSEERQGESFQFIHLTFCEYLAAVECATKVDRWNELIEAHRRFAASGEASLITRLVEVIPFALALMAKPLRPTCLYQIASLGDREVLGRCFLESQLYDQPEWVDYVSTESKYLASEGQSQRDEAWLRRLHLFNVVLRDAKTWMDQVAGRSFGPSLDGLMQKMIGTNREGIAEIFASYASQDASAALRLAESVGVDMLRDYTETVIQSCQEPPFLALALDRAEQTSQSQHLWFAILAEAGLRYKNVAYELQNAKATDSILDTVKEVSPSIVRIAVKSGSFYAIFLTAVLVHRDLDLSKAFKMVPILRGIRVRRIRIIGLPCAFILISFLTAGIAPIFTHRKPGVTDDILAVAAAIVLYVGMVGLWCGMVYYDRLLKAMCNTLSVSVTAQGSEPTSRRRYSFSMTPSRLIIVLGGMIGALTAKNELLALLRIVGVRGAVTPEMSRQLLTNELSLIPYSFVRKMSKYTS